MSEKQENEKVPPARFDDHFEKRVVAAPRTRNGHLHSLYRAMLAAASTGDPTRKTEGKE